MTKKRKSRARKSSVSNEVSKSQTSPAEHELSPTSQANQGGGGGVGGGVLFFRIHVKGGH